MASSEKQPIEHLGKGLMHLGAAIFSLAFLILLIGYFYPSSDNTTSTNEKAITPNPRSDVLNSDNGYLAYQTSESSDKDFTCPKIDTRTGYKIDFSCITAFEKERGYGSRSNYDLFSESEIMETAMQCFNQNNLNDDCVSEYLLKNTKLTQWEADNIVRDKIKEQVKETDNPELCAALQGTSRILSCVKSWTERHVDEYGIDICTIFPSKTFLQEDDKEINFYKPCIQPFITKAEDYDMCLSLTSDLEWCASTVAKYANRTDYCDKIIDDDFKKSECIRLANNWWDYDAALSFCTKYYGDTMSARGFGTCKDIVKN